MTGLLKNSYYCDRCGKLLALDGKGLRVAAQIGDKLYCLPCSRELRKLAEKKERKLF